MWAAITNLLGHSVIKEAIYHFLIGRIEYKLTFGYY